jgi:CRISPR-associated protein Cas8b/Csh1 subtype I-B
VVRVDLSEDEPRLAADEHGPIWVTGYSEDQVQDVAHCKYPAARGIDHSVTHQSGQNSDPEKLARYANERLTKWATDDVVQEAADDHDEGSIIDGLVELGEDEAVLDEVEDALKTALGGESTTALLTVQIQLDEDEGYRWPGELDVFMEAMRQRKLSKLVTKNKADDSSGNATDLVTGEPARTVGTSEDPQNYFLGKQLEKFPGLDIEEAWRTHPISEDAAVTVMNAETFVEACTYRTFGAKVYCLPYFFGRPSPDDTYKLYSTLYAAANEDENGVTPVERTYRNRDDWSIDTNRLRFYVSAVMPHQMSRYDVFGETLNGRIQYPAEIARSHLDVLRTAAFRDNDNWTAALPTNEKWDLLNDDGPLGAVASGWYFAQTLPVGDDDASADDIRIEALVDVLSGKPIPISMLLDGYVERLIEEDSDERFPRLRVASQYAQLCALARARGEFLAPDNEQQRRITEPPTYEPRTMTSREELTITDGGFAGEQNLREFIDDTPALEHDQRCGAFLLGALVGAVGNYQEWHESRSTTLVDQFPVKSISTNRIKKVTQNAIEKTLTYTREEKKRGGQQYPGTKFDYIVDRLRETILNPDPDEWDLDTNDLRFYYALGVTYGMNDRPLADNEDADAEAEEVSP